MRWRRLGLRKPSGKSVGMRGCASEVPMQVRGCWDAVPVYGTEMTLKPRARFVANPLPRRNRKECLMRRIASRLPTQEHLDAMLAKEPPALRKDWQAALKPYLRFEPREI
jgi:hypothetical protein